MVCIRDVEDPDLLKIVYASSRPKVGSSLAQACSRKAQVAGNGELVVVGYEHGRDVLWVCQPVPLASSAPRRVPREALEVRHHVICVGVEVAPKLYN